MLASLPEGSEAGLRRLARGEVAAAAIHLHRLDGDDEMANCDAVAAAPGLHDAVVIAFARREQGLLVAAGNPLQLRDIADIACRARSARTAAARGGGAAAPAGARRPRRPVPRRVGAGQAAVPDRRRYRPGRALRPRRLRGRHPRGRARGRARFCAAHLGAVRPGAAPARLFPAAAAGAGQVRALGDLPRPREPSSPATTWTTRARSVGSIDRLCAARTYAISGREKLTLTVTLRSDPGLLGRGASKGDGPV